MTQTTASATPMRPKTFQFILGCSIRSSASPASFGAAVICFFGFATQARYRDGPATASQETPWDRGKRP